MSEIRLPLKPQTVRTLNNLLLNVQIAQGTFNAAVGVVMDEAEIDPNTVSSARLDNGEIVVTLKEH